MRAHLSSNTFTSLPPRVRVLVPVGSVEQHGAHLPLDTDTVIATEVATAVVRELNTFDTPTVLAPAVSYGSSGEHQHFSGTSSVGTSALHTLIVELTRSMSTWAGQIVFVNGHGGNTEALASAVALLTEEGHSVLWVPCATEEVDLHAGRTETSLMLHLRPWDVRMHEAAPGNLGSLEELLPRMRAGGVISVSPNGVLGDPTGANADEGKRILSAMVRDVFHRIRARQRTAESA